MELLYIQCHLFRVTFSPACRAALTYAPKSRNTARSTRVALLSRSKLALSSRSVHSGVALGISWETAPRRSQKRAAAATIQRAKGMVHMGGEYRHGSKTPVFG